MPSLKAIRKRIASTKNTRKITRAMKLVAAAKLRRAQDAIIAARPYSNALTQVVSELAQAAGKDAHPLFADRKPAGRGPRASIVLFTSDRGLAGAFSANVVKKVEQFVEAELASYSEISLRIVGRKGNQHFTRRNANIASYDPTPLPAQTLELARETANRVIDDFLSERADRVYLIYNEFRSAISQGVVVKQLLPVVPEAIDDDASPGDFIYEPSRADLLDRLVPLYVQIGLYRAALESTASYFGAHMTSMENATRNAGEMIDKLTLQYNRARQASITKELLEIIGGAEALKG